MNDPRVEAGSYRDPGGRVFISGERVFRTVLGPAVEDYEFVRGRQTLESLISAGSVIGEWEADRAQLGAWAEDAHYVLEHPKLPFVSYPYEWCFSALQSAALLHLDIHLKLLEDGCTLSDASAYNVQFRGASPVFVDNLSFRKYREGEIWVGHKQFCEQFLNPLLLRAIVGIPHNDWFRGALEGIPAAMLRPMLPLRSKLRWNTFAHVVLQSSLQTASSSHKNDAVPRKINLPLSAQQRMLRSLRKWIGGLTPRGARKTTWSDYTATRSYASQEVAAKQALVAEFIGANKPRLVWDIGCNTGEFSQTALESGAEYAVGFDSDQGALELAFQRAREQQLAFLPLVIDVANPSPSQGWGQAERGGLAQRASADAILALAVVHHLAISRNVPLTQVIDWLVDSAPTGIIEFVPKSDPMVQELLRFRDDIFDDYSQQVFEDHLRSRAAIVRTETVSASDRQLYWFHRHNS